MCISHLDAYCIYRTPFQPNRVVDAFFKDVMKKTAEHPHCLTAGTALGLMDNFKRNNEALEGIAKGLEEFLEVRAFPAAGVRWVLYPFLHGAYHEPRKILRL